MMKYLLSLFVLFGTFLSQAQTFSFVNNSTTLIKTTDQSPAHWYIEIYNDANVDTMLRWKTFFDNVPAQWQINFDDQTNNSPDVNHGDSSDFALPIPGTFPQKLIIGAILNNTPSDGPASINFEIYDPYAPTVIDTISFIFIITQGSANLNELVSNGIISIQNEVISISNEKQSSLHVYNTSGKLILNDTKFESFDLKQLPSNQVLFLQIGQGSETYIVKIKR